ncbi:MAG: M56 family metallopeptidase [Oscillospiraceae bacterium]|nr:M56 family metallopeptidase [Oscillospiraceae bacterium]
MRELLVSSSALILALLLLRFLFRRTISRRVQYALWFIVLLRLLLPVGIGSSRFSAASMMDRLPEPGVSETILTVVGGDVPDLSVREPDPSLTEAEQREQYRANRQEWKEEVDRSRIETGGTPITVRGILRSVWFGGMGACALLILLQNLRFARRLRRTRVPLEGVESRYPVYLCDDIPSPCLFGLFRPAIYVTGAAARDERTLGYVLMHEETHARHLDPLWALLRSLCLAVWWFDPLVWLAAHFSRIDCELACDEGVLARLGEEERVPYGETLLALVPLRRSGTPLLSATTMTAGKRQMKDRIRRIAEHRRPLAVAFVLVLLLTGLVCAYTFTGGKKEQEPAVSAKPSTLIDRAGEYESPEAYLASLREEMTEVTFYSGKDLQEETAKVLDTRVRYLNRDGELPGLAPEGTLELYEYQIELKLDVEPDAVLLAGGAYITEDGWCDLEGQGGHSLVLLRYPDGSVSVLHDRANNDDRGGLYYHQESPEEMLYDWYVKENDLDLPLYTLDLLEQDPGRHPARRRDGNGWYLYIPVTGWAEENGGGGSKWVSQYGTGSSIIVRRATREEYAAERPKLMPGQRQRYVEAEDGRIWVVFTQYIPENITDHFEIAWEPELLEAMLESFTVE